MATTIRPAAGTPTQVAHPWRAVVRTIAAYLVVAVPALLLIIPIVQDELGPYLPESWIVWLGTTAAVLAALVGAVTRIMAIPGVQKLLDMVGLGTGVASETGHGRRADRDGVMDGRDTPSDG